MPVVHVPGGKGRGTKVRSESALNCGRRARAANNRDGTGSERPHRRTDVSHATRAGRHGGQARTRRLTQRLFPFRIPRRRSSRNRHRPVRPDACVQRNEPEDLHPHIRRKTVTPATIIEHQPIQIRVEAALPQRSARRAGMCRKALRAMASRKVVGSQLAHLVPAASRGWRREQYQTRSS